MPALNDMPAELAAAIAKLDMPDENRDFFGKQLWTRVLLGDDIEDALEYFDEDNCDAHGVAFEFVPPLIEEAYALRRKQLDALSEDDKLTNLTRAFHDLEEQGIVARENFSCCGNCASGEIHDERQVGDGALGYVYFHMQDTEGLVESRSTYLGYGAFLDSHIDESAWEALSDADKDREYERMTVDLMKRVVVPTFERHGIPVTWEGDLSRRILLSEVDYLAEV